MPSSHDNLPLSSQPALLYLVPACVGSPLLLALVTSDLKNLFRYEDHPAEGEEAAAPAAGDEEKRKKRN